MGACLSGSSGTKQTGSSIVTTAVTTTAPTNQHKSPTPPVVSLAPLATAQLANRRPSANSSPNRTAQSTSNTPPQSAAATPNTNTPLATSFTPLPTIPTLISPLNNRVLPSTPPSERDEKEAAGSDEVSRAVGADDTKGGENIAVAVDANAHSGGDVAYSFWQQIANPQRDRTFRPSQQPMSGRGGNQRLGQTIKATMRATLGGGDIQDTVKLPDGEDLNEWIAVNTLHFFNAASMIWATCEQFCTPITCPHMTAGRAEYLWRDDTQYKKPTALPACQYIDLLLGWVDEQISDPAIFPVEDGTRFPRSFQSVVRNIYKRLFRLYAHLYCTHSDKVRSIGANAHLNTCFKHFMYFSAEFGLIDESDQQPLARLILKMRENDSRDTKYR